MRRLKSSAALLAALLAASCQQAPPASPHYVLGAPYQAGGVWYYPRQTYDLTETGLAAVYPDGHAPLTADGELFDQSALAVAHQTLQLPAAARLTNLENGRQVLVRINDRGPATPHRIVEVTSRTAAMLGFPADGVARVRLELLAAESEAAADAVPGAPRLQIATAPVGEVQATALPPLGGGAPAPAVTPPAPVQEAVASVPPPAKLPETVTQTAPSPGALLVRLGSFQSYQYADIQRARVAGLGARIESSSEGRVQTFRVIIGPLTTVAQADSVLDQVIAAGVTDARIVVE